MENILEKIRASFSTVPNFQLPPEEELKKIRLLLYRDCERRGRKCLYDSKYVLKEGEKFVYKLPPGSTKEIRDLSEYIFGCVPLSDKVGTKRFCKLVDDDKNVKYVWSQVFCANGRNRWKGAGPIDNSSSSGYCTTSDDSSSSDLKKQQWSLPTILSYWTNQNPVLQSSHSLPGTFSTEVRTLLGLAVCIEESESPKNWPQHSSLIEKSTETYKEAALKAYNDPENFVKILHNFTSSYKNELLCSMLHPQTINLKTLNISNYRSLPGAKLLNKFISTYVKSSANVIIQTRRIDNYLKTVLFILKLVNTKHEVGLDVSNYDSGIYSVSEEYYPDPYNNSDSPGGGCTSSSRVSSSIMSTSSSTSHSTHNNDNFCSRRDSGVASTSSFQDDNQHQNPLPHEQEQEVERQQQQQKQSVSFHLGDNSEDEQTFNRLDLGDVDVSRLTLSSCKPIQMEKVMMGCSIENLDKYVNIEVQFDEKPLKFPSCSNDKLFFINYSNSVNKLYEMQWMHSSIDLDEQLNSIITKSKYIIYNMDKNSLKYVNVVERDCNVFEIVDYLVREKCSNEKITEYLLLHLDTI